MYYSNRVQTYLSKVRIWFFREMTDIYCYQRPHRISWIFRRHLDQDGSGSLSYPELRRACRRPHRGHGQGYLYPKSKSTRMNVAVVGWEWLHFLGEWGRLDAFFEMVGSCCCSWNRRSHFFLVWWFIRVHLIDEEMHHVFGWWNHKLRCDMSVACFCWIFLFVQPPKICWQCVTWGSWWQPNLFYQFYDVRRVVLSFKGVLIFPSTKTKDFFCWITFGQSRWWCYFSLMIFWETETWIVYPNLTWWNA